MNSETPQVRDGTGVDYCIGRQPQLTQILQSSEITDVGDLSAEQVQQLQIRQSSEWSDVVDLRITQVQLLQILQSSG